MDLYNDKESWKWPGEEYLLRKEPNCDMAKAKCMLNGMTVTQNEEDISYMIEESTPIKACGDLAYQFNNSVTEIMSKTPQDGKEYTSQVKRRRVLDFDSTTDDITSSFLKSKERIDSFDDIDILPEMSEWEACLQEDLCFEDLVQSEAWLADCLIDTDMNTSSDDGNAAVTSDIQIGINEVCNITPDSGPSMSQRPVRSSRNVIFKGRKSFMRAPSKLPSSVAYPFDFIKPSGVSGDVTLKDINQRILTPPPSKSKQVKEDPAYPTSAFSGKPVVGKTKIPTQGGKGSITIMRTKG
ncbi:protein XRI1 isoform X2 [Chenopodium quinoa]|uniref:protein XRI1 isoform X2 n=1 Tax=Chenopodium quinoa TaxID=63459 RepID=UPI000B78DDC1|nr:protein XRI1 isoform X2 [Chenopodium quinoa]